jgi:hypothetical protein
MGASLLNSKKSQVALLELNKLLEAEAFSLNQNIDHVGALTVSPNQGTSKDQFALRQGWVAMIYKDLRLRDRLFFSNIAEITGYSTQMWRKLMKAQYNVRDKSDNKLYHVSDKFIQIVTINLLKQGYVVDSETMVSYHRKTGAMARMFWKEGKCVEVMLQNVADGPDVDEKVRLVLNIKENHLKRLAESEKNWQNWSDLDLQRWVLWGTSKKVIPEMETKFNDVDDSINVTVSDENSISISVNKLPDDPLKLELTIERDIEGNLVVKTQSK